MAVIFAARHFNAVDIAMITGTDHTLRSDDRFRE
jgi:hypothetical protein